MDVHMNMKYIGSISLGILLFSAAAFALPAKDDKSAAEPGVTRQAPAAESPLDKEIRGMREQIAASPPDSLLDVRLGFLLLKKGAPDEAQLLFAEALKLSPRSHSALTGEGIVLARKGELRKAEQTLKEALAQNPNPVRAHYELGVVYEKLGEFDKALQEYKEGISKHQQGRK
jgi:Flp pilus assembly protein TadD